MKRKSENKIYPRQFTNFRKIFNEQKHDINNTIDQFKKGYTNFNTISNEDLVKQVLSYAITDGVNEIVISLLKDANNFSLKIETGSHIYNLFSYILTFYSSNQDLFKILEDSVSQFDMNLILSSDELLQFKAIITSSSDEYSTTLDIFYDLRQRLLSHVYSCDSLNVLEFILKNPNFNKENFEQSLSNKDQVYKSR